MLPRPNAHGPLLKAARGEPTERKRIVLFLFFFITFCLCRVRSEESVSCALTSTDGATDCPCRVVAVEKLGTLAVYCPQFRIVVLYLPCARSTSGVFVRTGGREHVCEKQCGNRTNWVGFLQRRNLKYALKQKIHRLLPRSKYPGFSKISVKRFLAYSEFLGISGLFFVHARKSPDRGVLTKKKQKNTRAHYGRWHEPLAWKPSLVNP